MGRYEFIMMTRVYLRMTLLCWRTQTLIPATGTADHWKQLLNSINDNEKGQKTLTWFILCCNEGLPRGLSGKESTLGNQAPGLPAAASLSHPGPPKQGSDS